MHIRCWLLLGAILVGCTTHRTPESTPPAASAPVARSEKAAVARQLIAQGEILVNLDPRRPGVIVPDEFKSEPRLVLAYGLDMDPPIPDLDIREDGISATLSFHGKPFKTYVPWTSVFAIVDENQNGRLWKEDVPADMPTTDEKHM